MVRFQMWLVTVFASVKPMARLMHTAWGWPLAESLHFIGLSLLVGTVGLFDLVLCENPADGGSQGTLAYQRGWRKRSPQCLSPA